MQTSEGKIELVEPRPYQKVGASFVISGWIPESWLDAGRYIALNYETPSLN